jgi:hypothetical protein
MVGFGASGAKVLATLTRSAPLSPPHEFTWREYAIFLLSIGAQIEHSLMVQYLYAAYSLGGPQVPEENRAEVAAWRQIILGIAKEEMGHLATVQNLLKFLDAPLALDREDYPWDSTLAPYPFALERLTRATLAKYVVAESPETWPAGIPVEERKEIEDLAAGSDGRQVNRVGRLYRTLIDLFDDEDRLPNSALHPETFPLQASWDEFARGYGKGARGSSVVGTTKTPDVLVIRVASRTDALAALKAVAEQGEAPGDAAAEDDEASHFRRFLTVYRAFPKDTGWDPTLPVPTNPVVSGLAAGAGQALIEDAQAGLWANVFNLRYRMLLSYLAHTYSRPDGVEHRQGVVINRMFGEMYNLRAIASILTRLPLNAARQLMCGPPFQMPYTLQLPDTDAAFWRLHLDLIAASKTLLKDPIIAAGDGADYATMLLTLDTTAAEQMQLYATAADVRAGTRHLVGALS